MNQPGPALALLLSSSFTVAGANQATAPTEAGGQVVVEAAEELAVLRENLVDRVLDGTIRSLVVVALRDGEVVWSEGFGWSDAQRSVPAGLDTVYPVGSLSK